jgi:AraC-like DNA-binding protein
MSGLCKIDKSLSCYLTQLPEAPRQLLSRETEVARAALNVGYESPSQFSREYRRLFGVPPSRDRPSAEVAPTTSLY